MVSKTRLGAIAFLLAISGCSCNDEDTTTTTEGAAANIRTHLDLLELTHLAEVDHQGLFIDFGSPAQRKYTIGNWGSSGWGSDIRSGETTAAYVGRRGRVYFHVDAPSALMIRIRLRAHGTERLSPYINSEELPSLTFEPGSTFRDYDFAIPAEHVVRGENYLLLAFGGVTDVGGEEVSVAVDSIRIVAGSAIPAGEYRAPVYASLRAPVTLEGSTRESIRVARPATLSWYVQVPSRAELMFGVGLEGEGEAPVTIRAVPESGGPVALLRRNATGEFQDQRIDLARFAGKIVRLDFEAAGGPGQIAWSAPRLVTPAAEIGEVEPARNVVVLLIDTLRATKLRPFNRDSRVRTPVIDQIAEEGTVFELAQASENWTKPSTAGVLTGLYPSTHGARTREARLPESAQLLSEQLHQNGFRTGGFIANGYVSDRFGFDQGWDYYRNYLREEESTEAEDVFEAAANWIEQNKDQRFFAYIHTIDPHVPYDPPAEFLNMYDDRAYEGQIEPRRTAELLEGAKQNPATVTFTASDRRRLEALHDGEISKHDRELGAFIERMRAMGLWENTLLVITSDHGEEFSEHGSWGHGHSVFQELLHVPLMFRLPGTVPARGRVPDAVSTIDISPTVLALLGVPPMPTEGRNLAGFMLGAPPAGPSVAFSDWLDDRRVMVTGNWKFLVRGNLTTSMFDLARDPAEAQQLDLSANPIPARFCRIMLGQFLGARNRGQWMAADQTGGSNIQHENAEIDDVLSEQLRRIGYVEHEGQN